MGFEGTVRPPPSSLPSPCTPKPSRPARSLRAEGKGSEAKCVRGGGSLARERRVDLSRARIVIFLNPQEKAYCNNPRGSDSKPAAHSMYLSYPPSLLPRRPSILPLDLHFQPSYGILHHSLLWLLHSSPPPCTFLLTCYKSHALLNRTQTRTSCAKNPESASRGLNWILQSPAIRGTSTKGGKPPVGCRVPLFSGRICADRILVSLA